MPGSTRPSKHTVYYELLDACTKGGCPICTMALDMVDRYLDAVIYESVNDPRTRDKVVAAHGYCNDHSWALRAMKGGIALGTALMYRDVLRHAAEEMARLPAGARRGLFTNAQGGGLLDRLAALAGASEQREKHGTVTNPHAGCPACQVRNRYELIYLGTLLDHLGDKEMGQALRDTGGLCLVHLDQAGAATRDASSMERLLDLQGECMQALYEELSEFIRKHDYRFKAEGMGAEGNSWIRAIEMVAGKPGIR